MVTWLTRSLTFIVVGAVLAFALTADHIKFDHDKVVIDVKTVGVILMLVGIFDLALNYGMSMYMRQPVLRDPYAAAAQVRGTYPTAPVARHAAPMAQPAPVYPPVTQPAPVYPPVETHETRVISRDDPNWH